MNEKLSEVSEKCVLQIMEVLKNADLKDELPSDVLVNVGSSVLGNIILAFISDNISKEERNKACNIFLQAIGGNVKNNFDAMFSVVND